LTNEEKLKLKFEAEMLLSILTAFSYGQVEAGTQILESLDLDQTRGILMASLGWLTSCQNALCQMSGTPYDELLASLGIMVATDYE